MDHTLAPVLYSVRTGRSSSEDMLLLSAAEPVRDALRDAASNARGSSALRLTCSENSFISVSLTCTATKPPVHHASGIVMLKLSMLHFSGATPKTTEAYMQMHTGYPHDGAQVENPHSRLEGLKML